MSINLLVKNLYISSLDLNFPSFNNVLYGILIEPSTRQLLRCFLGSYSVPSNRLLGRASTKRNVFGSMQKLLLNFRQKLIDSDVVIDEGNKLVFNQNHEFSSPSTVAAIVMGRTANGLKEWKLKKGKSKGI